MSRIYSRKFALEQAREQGMTVVKGSDTRILLDLDDGEDEEFYATMLPVICEHIKLEEEKRWRSKNGGLHVQLLSPRPLNVRSRLLIQACLGSDRVKEFLSLVRVWKKESDPVMLFRPPVKKPSNKPSPLQSILDDDVPF